MDNSEKSEKIREYISKNKGVTEHKVAKYMAKNHYCARDTTHNLIHNFLIPDGKVIDKKVGNSFHKLYINNNDEFTILMHRIDRTYELITRYGNAFLESTKKMFKEYKPFRDLVYLQQLILYTRITDIASKIGLNVESNDNREILYLRLVQLLDKSDKLNMFIAPLLLPSLDSLLENVGKGGITKEMVEDIRGTFKDIRSEVEDLYPSSNLT